jgi:hypothetical protein
MNRRRDIENAAMTTAAMRGIQSISVVANAAADDREGDRDDDEDDGMRPTVPTRRLGEGPP